MPPRVTLIIPTYNRAALVTRAIDSALAQTYPDLDLIVVDDGSTDQTQTVLERYGDDPRVLVIRLDNNVGVTAAKNVGLAHLAPSVKYFGILDSDDVLTPAAIETLVATFERGDQYSQVFGWCIDERTSEATGTMPFREGLVTYDDALSGRFSGEFWQLVRRDILGDRRFDERAAGAESAVWWPMLRERDGWLVDAVVRIYDSAGTDRVSTIAYTASTALGRMWACHAGLAPIAEDLRTRYPERYGGWLLELAKWAALAGEGGRARSAAREAIRYVRSVRALMTVALVHMPVGIVRLAARWRQQGRRAVNALNDLP